MEEVESQSFVSILGVSGTFSHWRPDFCIGVFSIHRDQAVARMRNGAGHDIDEKWGREMPRRREGAKRPASLRCVCEKTGKAKETRHASRSQNMCLKKTKAISAGFGMTMAIVSRYVMFQRRVQGRILEYRPLQDNFLEISGSLKFKFFLVFFFLSCWSDCRRTSDQMSRHSCRNAVDRSVSASLQVPAW